MTATLHLPRALLAAILALGCAAPAIAEGSYSRNGPYFDLGAKAPLESSERVRLRGGVPEVRYETGWYRNPVTVAQYGLQRHAYGTTRSHRPSRRAMLRAADWLVRNQARDGGWRYGFEFRVSGMRETLAPGWLSGMAQGQAVSLLVRSWRATGAKRYLKAARSALGPLRRSVARGGVLRKFGGGWWYEEYPTKRGSYALNGHMFTLLGLYDLAPWSKTSKRLYREGRQALIGSLRLYDRPSGPSAYHLGYRYGYGYHVSEKYHAIHVMELQALNWIGPSRTLRRWRDRWAASG